ncbi:hypothetical protein FRB90_008735 [Tulasnella sp. 427]|nr:hypothetical protein FRB90_008735 [Tulasnella sp. 427]
MIPPSLDHNTSTLNVPRSFGEDGGHFYKYYDDISNELDEDLVKSLKSQLDGILIFAGLFAGVNSTFLALTLPQMKADPSDDTNALLLHISRGGNEAIQSSADLPSVSFSPPPGIYPVNVLLSMSLTLALLSSFLAVLGQQWLIQYRKRSGGGAEHQRWEQLRRHLGAERWRLEPLLDDILPGLLQLGMIIFCASFIIYLGTLDRSMCIIVAAPIGLVVAILLAVALCAAWDQWCPFKSPLSRLMQRTFIPLGGLVLRFFATCYHAGIASIAWFSYYLGFILGIRSSQDQSRKSCASTRHQIQTETWGEGLIRRSPESIDRLKLIALKRVIAVSEDPRALTHALLNMRAIYKKEDLEGLIGDAELSDRLRRLIRRACDDGTRLAEGVFDAEQARIIGSSFLYLVLSGGSMLDILSVTEKATFSHKPPDDETAMMDFLENAQLVGSATVAESENPCVTCCSCVELRLCGGLMSGVSGWALSTRSIYLGCLTFAVQKYDGRGSLQLLCILSSLVNLLKEGSNARHGRIQSMERKMEILQGLPDLYSGTKQACQMGRLVGEALATSASIWEGRPIHDVYVYLFKEGCFLADLYGEGLESILENAGSLLISIDQSILAPQVSASTKEKHAGDCTRIIDILTEVLLEPSRTYPRRLRIYNATASSIVSYFKWLDSKRTSQFRPGLSKLLRRLLPFVDGTCLPNPDTLLSGAPDGSSPDLVARYQMNYSALRELYSTLENSLDRH